MVECLKNIWLNDDYFKRMENKVRLLLGPVSLEIVVVSIERSQ